MIAVDDARAMRASLNSSRGENMRWTRNASARSTIAIELSEPELPDELTAALVVDGFPEGFSKIWSGTMFVSGTAKPLIAWRRNQAAMRLYQGPLSQPGRERGTTPDAVHAVEPVDGGT